MKVLLAEDDRAFLFLLEKNVKRLGHECLVARDGRQAWEMYQQNPDVRVVISDWMMPEMDGLELCRRVRGLARETYTFFIILTALGSRERLLEGLQAGADEFLVKPLDREQLQARLAVASRVTALHRHASEQSVAEPFEDGSPVSPQPSPRRPEGGDDSEGESTKAWSVLISQGKIDEEQLQTALEIQSSDPGSETRELGEILVSQGIISKTDLARMRAFRSNLSYVDLDARDVDPLVLDLIPEQTQREHGLVPMRLRDGRLFVATSDPTDISALKDLSSTSGFTAVPVVTSTERIQQAQDQLFGTTS